MQCEVGKRRAIFTLGKKTRLGEHNVSIPQATSI